MMVTLQGLNRLDISSDSQDGLNDALNEEGCVQSAPDSEPVDLQCIVDHLDKALDSLEPSNSAFPERLHRLESICSTWMILPESHVLSSHPPTVNPFPFTQKGYCDVHVGFLDGSIVCVKRVRTYAQDVRQKAAKVFYKEAVVWKRLKHPNVVSLLGITATPLQLVLDTSGRDIPDYMRETTDPDRPRLLSNVAEGLSYIHSCGVVHGALKGSSVLVDDAGRAQITDFCFATVGADLDSEPTTSHLHDHAVRWTAPEVLEGGKHTKRADVFSLAMLMIEIFAGTIPFHDAPSYMAMSEIVQGNRPPRPEHPAFTENMWILMQLCWDANPNLRPEALEVLQALAASSMSRPLPWFFTRVWKRLFPIADPMSVGERKSPIVPTFFDPDEVNAVEHYPGESSFVSLCYERLTPPTEQHVVLSTMPGDYGFQLRDSLHETAVRGGPRNASRFLDPPRANNPRESFRGWLARITRNVFNAIKTKAMRGYARLGKY